jgi:hypothetical protein
MDDGRVTGEDKIASHARTTEHAREPVRVIRPHRREGQVVSVVPLGRHFLRFNGRHGTRVRRSEDVDVEARVGRRRECESEVSNLSCGSGREADAALFVHFTKGRVEERLAGIDLTAEAIEFSGPKATFLPAEEYALTVDKEEQREVLRGRSRGDEGECE